MRSKFFLMVFICIMAISSIAGPQVVNADDAVLPEPSPPPAAAIAETPIRGILGRMVQDADGKDMGRIIDVLIDPAGNVRGAIIDFGGFFGVGSRKIAVDWSALHFYGAVRNAGQIRLALSQDQLKAAPEYKDGNNTVVAISSTGALEPLNFLPAVSPPEK